MFLLIPLLILAILLEGTVTTIPLILVCLLLLTILRRGAFVFLTAFFAGLVWDVLTLHRVGGASIFLLVFVFLILLYQRKYEINSYPFVFASSFLGGLLFLTIFGNSGAISEALVGSMIAGVLFTVVSLKKLSFRAK